MGSSKVQKDRGAEVQGLDTASPTRPPKKNPVDWSKVPVVIEGTPNPEAVRLLWESVREFEISQRVKQVLAEKMVAHDPIAVVEVL